MFSLGLWKNKFGRRVRRHTRRPTLRRYREVQYRANRISPFQSVALLKEVRMVSDSERLA